MSTRKDRGAVRVRRTAEEARAEILAVAERRLSAHGLSGLAIADVAREAGMSHGTLLHHFGSSEGMRSALVARMAERLLDEVLHLESQADPAAAGMGDFFERLFAQLSGGGHARLIAWMMLSRGDESADAGAMTATAARFDHLVGLIAERLRQRGAGAKADRVARYIVLLVISSAIGLGVARDSLLPQLALSGKDEAGFARWLSDVIGTHLSPGAMP